MTHKDLNDTLIIGWIVWFFSSFLAFLIFQGRLEFPLLITSGYMVGAFFLNPDKKIYRKYWGIISFVWDFYYLQIQEKVPNLHKLFLVNTFSQISYLGVILILLYALFYVLFSGFISIFTNSRLMELGEVLQVFWALFTRNPIAFITWMVGLIFGNTWVTFLVIKSKQSTTI